MAEWNELDLGGVDAYAAAVKAGYTGTRQQWMTAMQDAEANGLKAEGYANGKQNGTAVESGTYFHDNAQYYKEQAEAAKTAAQAAQAAAESAAETDLVAWLEQHITNPDSPPLDRTLASSSSAAPADMVGDLKSALSSFETDVDEYLFNVGKNLINPDKLVSGYISGGNGAIAAGDSYKTTDFIPMKNGVDITISPKARIMLAYNTFKEPIPSTYNNTTINTGNPFTYTPSQDGYVRFSVYTADTMMFQAEYGSSATTFEEFTLSLNPIIQVDKLNYFLIESRNLFDKSEAVVGFIQSDSGVIDSTATTYMTTDYIPIVAGQKITISPKARARLFYDYQKSPKSGGYDNSSAFATGKPVTLTSSYTGFIRISFYASDVDKFQVEYGEAVTEYQPFGLYYLNENRIEVESSKNIQNEIDEMVTKTVNLINPDKMTPGYISYGDGTISASDSFITTDFIPMKSGQKITVSPKARIMLCYNEQKTPVGTTYNNTTINTGSAYTYTPSFNGFIRFSMFTVDTGKWQAEYGDSATSYVPYGYKVTNKVLTSDNYFAGKKWAVCGDSFSDGVAETTFTDPPYQGMRKVYPYYIGRRTGIEILKFFASGKTLAYPADHSFTNCLTCPSSAQYYQNIPADVDYITIYLGINDSHHENGQGGDGEDPTGIIPIGTIDDNTTDTYYGAWNVVLSWLRENRPFAHVGIIVSNGCDRIAYREAQIAVAKKYGIAYIDLNGDQRTPAMIRCQNNDIAQSVKLMLLQTQAVDYPTNTHPNDAAHEYESWFIENFLRTI